MKNENAPYKKLLFYKMGYEFLLEIYRVTKNFPDDEQYGLTSQLRRAAVSVVANIVEGSIKKSRKDFFRYINISQGSLNECQFLLELSCDLGYLRKGDYEYLEELRAKTAFLLFRFMNPKPSKAFIPSTPSPPQSTTHQPR